MRQLFLLALLITLPGIASHSQAAEPNADPRLTSSRQITHQFMRELKGTLQQTMSQSGPVAAIKVCKTLAPDIAARLSAEHGVTVGRSSLKLRNPANAPDAWQQQVLEDFESRHRQGKKPRDIEQFSTLPDGSARYMKAIGTQPLCLNCHGKSITPEVRQILLEEYPNDQAIGFATGDIRGAFRIDWPAKTNTAD